MASTTTQIAGASVLNIRSLNNRTKQEYLNSFGTFSHNIGPFGRWKVWNVVDRVNQVWSELEVQISALLEAKASEIRPPRIYSGPKDPCHALRCYMVGLNQDHASPHVAIICDQMWVCTQVRDIVLASGLLQERGWSGFLKLHGTVRRPGGTTYSLHALSQTGQPTTLSNPSPRLKLADKVDESSQDNVVAIALPSDPLHRTLRGIRIAVSGSDGLVAVATLGGTVDVNGKIYGLTASHVFLSGTRSNDKADNGAMSNSQSSDLTFDEDDLDPFIRLHSPTEISELQIQEPGTQAADTPPSHLLADTLPSLTMEPVASGREDEPMHDSPSKKPSPVTHSVSLQALTTELSYIPSTSWTLGSVKMFGNTSVLDFEWALVSTSNEDLHMTGNVNEVHMEGSRRLRITSIAEGVVPDGKALLLATARGGVSGLGISSRSLLKLNSSRGYQYLETVKLDHVQEGDCGSWAVDVFTGELLGMLVASCDIVHEAYVLPAREVFAEIMRVSGKSVALPSFKEAEEPHQATLSKLRAGFPYQSLGPNEIRILSVLPGTSGTSIECRLSVRNIEDPGEYEALSYAWETWTLSSHINVHHQSVNITPNLASALEVLRFEDKPRHLWVDALCINQQDAEERGTQVALMAKVMERATNVCIWLGEEDEDTQWAFSSDQLLDIISHSLHGNSDESSLRRIIALCGLVKRSWFHRRWCLQDVCLAKEATLYCGTYSMLCTTFAEVITLLHFYLDEPSNSLSHSLVQSKWRSVRNPLSDLMYLGIFFDVVKNAFRRVDNGVVLDRLFSLEALVSRLVWLETAIPHDSIYSLLSLARDFYWQRKSSLSLHYEYGKLPSSISSTVLKAAEAFLKPLGSRRPKASLSIDYFAPFEDVCRDFIHMAIHESNSLDIICRPWAPAIADLPSWVTTVSQASMGKTTDNQFVRINADALVGRGGPDGSIKYEASGPCHPTFHFDAQRLCVKGFLLDTVYATESLALMGNIPPGWIGFLGWTDVSTLPPENVWRLLIADRGLDGRLPPRLYRLCCAQVFKQTQPGYGLNRSERFKWITSDHGLNISISQQLAHSEALVQKFLRRIQSVVWGRRLISTRKNKLLGLAPAETKNSDVIAILYGCSVPVVLRQVPDPSGDEILYKLIGECYIDGMMDGQALVKKDQMNIDSQTFVIV